MDFHIPAGLTELMQDFTVVALRERPTDIVEFAADYFIKLRDNRRKEAKPKGVSFQVQAQKAESESEEGSDEEPEPPKNKYIRRQSVCAEAYNPDESDSDEDEKTVVHPKTDAQRKRLNEAVKNILLFKNLEAEQLNQVLDAMFERKTVVNEHIIDQGDDGDNFYVIDKGVFDIYVKIDGVDKKVGTYNNKGSFGELALMYNTPRAATIVSASEGIIWALDRITFRRILLKAAYQKRKMHEQLLEKVPMLGGITEHERMNLADALESRTFNGGELIIKQGDEAEHMFFVERGVVSVTMTSPNDPTLEVEVTKLSEGAYFGELALVTHKPRAASVVARGPCRVAALDIMAFERLLGPCMDLMKRNIGDYEEQLKKLGLSNRDLRGK